VLVIVLDTARPDYLSVYGHARRTSPFLEEFARAGTPLPASPAGSEPRS